MAKGSGKSGMDLHSGLTKKSPPCYDKSMSIPKGNTVNEPTRTGTAPTPSTIGNRVA